MAEDKVEGSLENRRFGGVSRLYGPELRERFLKASTQIGTVESRNPSKATILNTALLLVFCHSFSLY